MRIGITLSNHTVQMLTAVACRHALDNGLIPEPFLEARGRECIAAYMLDEEIEGKGRCLVLYLETLPDELQDKIKGGE